MVIKTLLEKRCPTSYWNRYGLLSSSGMYLILRLAALSDLALACYSGDDHDYCELVHSSPLLDPAYEIREISVKSLSMAMGIKRPGFQLLSLTPLEATMTIHAQATYADQPCFLPDQLAIYLYVYIPLLVISLFVVLLSNSFRVLTSQLRVRHQKQRSSSRARPLLALGSSRRANSSEEESSSDNSSYPLPQPISTPSSKLAARQPTCIWFSVTRGRRIVIRRPQQMVDYCWPNDPRTRKHKRRSFLGCVILDTRDVAVFPLTVFVVASVWLSFS